MDLLPYMKQWNMLPPKGGTILCAVSGGRDSICLLDYLCRLAPQCGFALAAAHLNHLMRPTAQRDVDFVTGFCRERNIPLYLAQRDVCALAAEKGIGEEEAGRQARYEFLETTAQEIGAERIATAHHRQDQAETVILNLLRGTGPDGLCGIPPVREKYIRPLLQTSRREVEDYLTENHLSHIEDETNENRDYARNRLRLDLWPQLEEIHSGAADHIAHTAELLRRENQFLDQLAARYLPRTGTEISCAALHQAPPVLQNRMVRQLLERLPAGKKDVTAAHIEAVVGLCSHRGTVALPAGMMAVCDGTVLRLTVQKVPPEELRLHSGVNRWGDYTLTLLQTEEREISVRAWHSEDRMTLPGSRGSRTLKRLFAEKHILPPERELLPVVTVDQKVAVVYGIGTDVQFEDWKINIEKNGGQGQ